MQKPTIIFFGNTKYSIIGLQIINTTYPILLIVTKNLDFNPVKQIAAKLTIPIIETNQLNETAIKNIKNLNPDFLVVEDYGLILPTELLNTPKYASLNIHHSLLPKYRGPSPAPSAILAGEKMTGLTIIRMTDKVDAGDILAQEEYLLSDRETTDSLLNALNKLGGKLLVEVIKKYLEGNIKSIQQNSSEAILTPRLTKEDGYFDINNPPSPEKLDRMIRAYYPWPGVWTRWNNKIVKFLPLSHPVLDTGSINNNRLLDSRLRGNDKFLIQMEGKKVMPLRDFLNGYPDFPLKKAL